MVATPHTHRIVLSSSCALRSSLADGGALNGGGLAALTEAILKLALNGTEVAHAASSDSLPADSLGGPVVAASLAASTTAGITSLLLVPVGETRLAGHRVRLVVALALRCRSGTLLVHKELEPMNSDARINGNNS